MFFYLCFKLLQTESSFNTPRGQQESNWLQLSSHLLLFAVTVEVCLSLYLWLWCLEWSLSRKTCLMLQQKGGTFQKVLPSRTEKKVPKKYPCLPLKHFTGQRRGNQSSICPTLFSITWGVETKGGREQSLRQARTQPNSHRGNRPKPTNTHTYTRACARPGAFYLARQCLKKRNIFSCLWGATQSGRRMKGAVGVDGLGKHVSRLAHERQEAVRGCEPWPQYLNKQGCTKTNRLDLCSIWKDMSGDTSVYVNYNLLQLLPDISICNLWWI